jgi:hypothetical protein
VKTLFLLFPIILFNRMLSLLSPRPLNNATDGSASLESKYLAQWGIAFRSGHFFSRSSFGRMAKSMLSIIVSRTIALGPFNPSFTPGAQIHFICYSIRPQECPQIKTPLRNRSFPSPSFTILEEAKQFRRNWVKSEEGRSAMMQLLIKAAYLSNVARSFELADRWSEDLCEEFFRQGELEKASGMEYSSPMNDREHLDKVKSQIGFLETVCLPLFEEIVTFDGRLADNVSQVRSNLAVWKHRDVRKSHSSGNLSSPRRDVRDLFGFL